MSKRIFYIGGLILLIAIAGSVSLYLIAKKPAPSVSVLLPEEAAKPEVTAPTPAVAPPTGATPTPEVVKEEEKVDTTGWKEYRNEKMGIQFYYPPQREVMIHNNIILIGGPFDETGGYNPDTDFGIAVEIISNPNRLHPGIWWREKITQERERLARLPPEEQLPVSSILESRDTEFKGLPAFKFRAWAGDSTEETLFVSYNTRIYVISYFRYPATEGLQSTIVRIIESMEFQ